MSIQSGHSSKADAAEHDGAISAVHAPTAESTPLFGGDGEGKKGQERGATKAARFRSFLRRQVWEDECTVGAVFGTRDKESWSQELSGSLGDLGTFLPIILNLAATGQIDLAATFVWAGIYNIVTGLSFRIPMCVQPMKAIAVAALAGGWTTAEIMSAGLGVAAMVFLIGVTGLIKVFNYVFPDALVKGIQVGMGITLMGKAAQLLPQVWTKWDGYPVGLIAFTFTVVAVRYNARDLITYARGGEGGNKKKCSFCSPLFIPAALILFVAGLIPAAVDMAQAHPHSNESALSIYQPQVVHINSTEFLFGFVSGSLPQLPLTTMNSVIALCQMSKELFPTKPAQPSRVCLSVGILNLIGCFFGCMPMCHGAGGLTGQHRFGARSHLSMLMLGTFKLVIGLFFGTAIFALLGYYPKSILAVLLFQGGLSLAESAILSLVRHISNVGKGKTAEKERDEKGEKDHILRRWHTQLSRRDNAMIFVATAGSTVAFHSAAIGLLTGFLSTIIVAVVVSLLDVWQRRRTKEKREEGKGVEKVEVAEDPCEC
mmetsp:Transcript_48421/g.125610  ORF Transcript_48421/g.125610 Transcript_48421/m.125610 type:complete len:542 (-) Transcript_48421:66-1691(-)